VTQTIRVLMVDDNRLDVEVVRVMLRQYPLARFELASLESTEDCLATLEGQRFDLLLLDQHMPGEDGLSFLNRIKGRSGVPPIIMLTGEGDERLAAEAMRLGAYDYFPKRSINSTVLARAVHQALEKFQLDQQLENTETVIFTLAAAVEAKDPTTGQHLHRMTSYAVSLGRAVSLDPHDLMMLKYGAILHDIGKVGVSEAILRKPGALTEDEWEEIRQHPVIGERICAHLRFSREVAPMIRHHHERWDGAGYVDGLSGERIPYLARIIGLVDSYDAMSSDRPYRRALPKEEIVRQLDDGAGKQWDPELTAVLVKLLSEGHLRPVDDSSHEVPGLSEQKLAAVP